MVEQLERPWPEKVGWGGLTKATGGETAASSEGAPNLPGGAGLLCEKATKWGGAQLS